jgi:hypothetical protein
MKAICSFEPLVTTVNTWQDGVTTHMIILQESSLINPKIYEQPSVRATGLRTRFEPRTSQAWIRSGNDSTARFGGFLQNFKIFHSEKRRTTAIFCSMKITHPIRGIGTRTAKERDDYRNESGSKGREVIIVNEKEWSDFYTYSRKVFLGRNPGKVMWMHFHSRTLPSPWIATHFLCSFTM